MSLSLLDDTGGEDWPRVPFGFTLGVDFKNLTEALAYLLSHNLNLLGQHAGEDQKAVYSELLSTGTDGANPAWFTRPYFADTSPGGNDAINCYWQFNRDDDIVHPITRSGEGDGEGMGRVYAEMIESNQQILWMTFGVSEFTNIAGFYKNAINRDLAVLMRNGGGTLAEIGSVLGKAVGFVVSLPFYPLILMDKLFHWATQSEVTKYYDFKQTMLLYYEFVNTMLVHLGVNLNMYGAVEEEKSDKGLPHNNANTPKFMSKDGPDIFAIMQLRAKRANPEYLIQTTKEGLAKLGSAPSWWKNWFSSVKEQALGAGDYIGFRVEKSVDSSESFSNQSGESSLASTLNGQASSAIDSNFTAGGAAGFVKSAIAGVADAIGAGGGVSVLMGTAFIDIPEIWKGSSFGKSHSVTFKLRAPYGDKVSIMQSIYLPLALILAGTLPRAAGRNSYTSPFLCRCYCKGMFSIPLGLIESVNITRGDSEFGWNNSNLPTVVTVSMSIKDLSPAMYMSLGDGKWKDIFGQNSSFQEYMLTLSGMGLNERVLFTKNLTRRAKIWLKIREKTGVLGLLLGHGSAPYWGSWAGELAPIRTIGAINPLSKIPSN